ncbi:hypothetical protein B0H16DRAFT_1361730 [Mycena metata]|uniref:Glycoside hydrolase family 78 protein n=1 Tax=Mycena metata TaxID=1033252 RepID=A0AAD7NUG0_9AGAR|nr:hypothetical protein B0H16DRAFT_1361730 [Mycena metata]
MAPMYIFALLSLATAGLPMFSRVHGSAAAGVNHTTVPAANAAQSVLSFAASDWIWSSTVTASAEVAFRKDFTPPFGKSLIAAEIIITAVDDFNLFVNGDYIGSGSFPGRWGYAQRFCIDLLPSFNVFAVNATTPNAGLFGLIATILVTFSDGTADTLVTNSAWLTTDGSPVGFEQLGFDDTTWATATSMGVYTGVYPYEIVIPSNPADITLFSAIWVWTNIIPTDGNLAPGSQAFRRTFTPAPGQLPMSATILISVDNGYTVYVNGVLIGGAGDFLIAQQYIVNFATPPSEIVLAVLATNAGTTPNPAGVLVMMEVNMQPAGRTNCMAGSIVATDAAWRSPVNGIPTGFEQPGFDDSSWSLVAGEGTYPVAPWNTLTIAAPSAPITI